MNIINSNSIMTNKEKESMMLMANIDVLPNISEFIREQRDAEKKMREVSREKSIYDDAGYKIKSTI